MTNVYELPDRTDPLDEASEWLARMDRGLGDAEQAALQQWLGGDPRNSAALMEAAELWDKMDSLSRLAELFPEPVQARARSPRLAWAVAASVLVAAVTGAWLALEYRSARPHAAHVVTAATTEQVFATEIGESNTVMLPDGSRLMLNTNSSIRVRYSAERRQLVLERGEVFVEVAPDPTRPMRVQIGDRIVEALGTAFNLRMSNDQSIELIVTEGRVRVAAADGRIAGRGAVARNVSAPPSLTVSAGQRMLLTNEDVETHPVAPAEIEVRLSWRDGNLVFRGESLAEALAEIGRYTAVGFVIADDDLKGVRIFGRFKGGDVDGLLATLRQNFDIAHSRNGDEIVLTKAPL